MSLSIRKSSLFMLVLIMALACAVCLAPLGVNAAVGDQSNPLETTNIDLQFGDPAYPATAPESLMKFEETATANAYDAVYTDSDAANYYPEVLALYFTRVGNENFTLNSNGVDFLAYAADGTESVVTTPITSPDNFYAIRVGSTGGTITVTSSGSAIVISFDAPKNTSTGSSSIVVNGYLPGISQYATGSSYGSISTGDNNTLAVPANVKTLGANAGNMVSLGSSGYIQYELPTAITNHPNNPFGVDFIVYGNPFNGNPEAGMVEVAGDVNGAPGTWYRLAGSRHYESDTIMNTNVTYTKGSSAITAAYGSTTTTFSNLNWWPLYAPKNTKPAGENYGDASGIDTAKITGVSYPDTDTTITYTNRTVVADDATQTFTGTTAEKQAAATNYYAFGYADVRNIGSNFGVAANPYATLPSAGAQTGYNGATGCGGDGFDLAWAVNADGTPATLPSGGIKYIRVYSATVYNAGIFGETSTEVSRIATVTPAGSDVGTTTAPTVKYGASSSAMNIPLTASNLGTASRIVSAGTYYINASNSTIDNFYINNNKVSSGDPISFTVVSGKTTTLRVIAQDDDDQPYIMFVKFTGN